jgi:myosin heavy subunit
MRKFSIYLILFYVVIAVSSCGESAKEREQRELIDSLQNANAQGRMDYEDLEGYLSIIANGLDSISIEEKEIFIDRTPGEKQGLNKQRMRQQLSHVRDILARHRERIDELEKRLSSSNENVQSLKTIIAALKEQLDQKDRELAQLKADLNDSRKSIADLQNRVSLMQSASDAQQDKIEEQESQLQEQANQLNTAYLKIATKKQLKNEGLLAGGFLKKSKVDYSKVNLSSFKTIDIRTTKTINVPDKAKIITPVPTGSYTLSNGILTIKNPEQFWSVSNFLIIQTD